MQQRLTQDLLSYLSGLSDDERIKAINEFRKAIHSVSPFRDEPVDCVLWIKNEHISPNDYNPNNVAPPEKKLLLKSIEADGFTQPIVATQSSPEEYEIVDGFHRHELGKGKASLKSRLKGYLPITCLEGNVMTAWRRRFATTAPVAVIRSTRCLRSCVNWHYWDGKTKESVKNWGWTRTKSCA